MCPGISFASLRYYPVNQRTTIIKERYENERTKRTPGISNVRQTAVDNLIRITVCSPPLRNKRRAKSPRRSQLEMQSGSSKQSNGKRQEATSLEVASAHSTYTTSASLKLCRLYSDQAKYSERACGGMYALCMHPDTYQNHDCSSLFYRFRRKHFH